MRAGLLPQPLNGSREPRRERIARRCSETRRAVSQAVELPHANLTSDADHLGNGYDTPFAVPAPVEMDDDVERARSLLAHSSMGKRHVRRQRKRLDAAQRISRR